MNLKCILLVTLFLLNITTVYALSTDKDQAMHIEANSVELDDARGLTIYRGDVRIRQGSLRVTGSTLIIERTDGKVRMVTIVGKPAHYSQRPDNKEQDVTASARKLQIYPDRDLVRLERDASITQDGNHFSGNIIEYDNKNNIITAKGNIGATDTGRKQSGRIRMTIQPRKKQITVE